MCARRFTVISCAMHAARFRPRDSRPVFREGSNLRWAHLDDFNSRPMVKMRFFEALHLSAGTIERDWRLAKVWLARKLSPLR